MKTLTSCAVSGTVMAITFITSTPITVSPPHFCLLLDKTPREVVFGHEVPHTTNVGGRAGVHNKLLIKVVKSKINNVSSE